MRLKIAQCAVCAGVALGIGVALTACSQTWSGVQQDTRENVETVGRGVEKAGEKIQESVK